jgi:serine/threonine protein phosphatase PrpC
MIFWKNYINIGTFSAQNHATFYRILIKFYIGDGNYKPYVCSDPDVTTIVMNGTEDFLIVACDGLWDTVTPDEATECVFKQLQKDKGEPCL